MTTEQSSQAVRSVYLVLSPRSLSYARHALESLWTRCLNPLNLHLITDSEHDKVQLAEYMDSLLRHPTHTWSVSAAADLDEREAALFSRFPNLRAFRRGHPCWRKITDPLLLAAPEAEIILLDPDVFFPNHFNFEITPANELLLMWQKPNCLLPHSVVTRAMQAGIRVANHVDIGVAQWHGPNDMDWLEWMIGVLGGAELPRSMHVEAIVWAGLALRMSGGYLDPALWHCWHRSQLNRVLRLLKVPGQYILTSEPWNTIKCFHGGGEAKWWVPSTIASGVTPQPATIDRLTAPSPFIELTPAAYRREQTFKRLLHRTGYYSLFRNA